MAWPCFTLSLYKFVASIHQGWWQLAGAAAAARRAAFSCDEAQLRRAAALGVPGDLEPSQRQRHQHLGASPDSRNVVKEGITRAWRIWKDLATFDISLPFLPFFSWGGLANDFWWGLDEAYRMRFMGETEHGVLYVLNGNLTGKTMIGSWWVNDTKFSDRSILQYILLYPICPFVGYHLEASGGGGGVTLGVAHGLHSKPDHTYKL